MRELTDTPALAKETERGELFSLLLRLHPVEAGQVSPGAGNQVQAAFLDMLRQSDQALSDWLHTPNQRRPYTLSLLQGFNHVSPEQLAAAMNQNRGVDVMPGQVYWLRVTMLDTIVFKTFIQHLITKSRTLRLRIGDVSFEVSRLLTSPGPDTSQNRSGYSSFAELYTLCPAQKCYHFEFISPTTFSRGQKAWGKYLKLFPEPADVFESLARQWEIFAPEHLRMQREGLTPGAIAMWCQENVIVSQYTLTTRHLCAAKFGQTGFLGEIVYEVKGAPTAPAARWLTPLAHFAPFSGVGYKTTMGMGQTRCITITLPQTRPDPEQVINK